ncbi:MAG: hypothetical protein IJ371_04740 [Clostridia bacterium]|nr:hypothetical protein [Clostridia bacterium]
MFNWFRSKVELKNNNSIMTSFHNRGGIKIGNEIVVPQNFECLIYKNGKHYNTLPCGKYKMDKKTFIDLIEHQQKLKANIKHIKCVCHYVNISAQKLEIRVKKQSFVVDFNIDDSVKFATLLLLYNYKVDNDYTIDTLNGVFVELLLYHKMNYNQIKSNALSQYGIVINSFLPINRKVSIFNKSTSDTQSKDSTTIFNQQNTQIVDSANMASTNQSNNESPKSNPSPISNVNPTSSTAQLPACPKCNHISKFNTTFCIRCGHKFDN